MTEPALLDVKDLVVSFGRPSAQVKVVKGVSLTIAKGETVALVGESGSGKTVTSLAVLGLVGQGKKTESVVGSIQFLSNDGQRRDLSTLDKQAMRKLRGNEIAMIFQEPMTSLNPVLRIGIQIAEVLIEHHNETRAKARQIAEDLLTRVGIPDAARRMRSYPHELSGGMRQRVMIAMALSCRPSLLIADEPTTALDVTIQAQILDLIGELKDEYGSSVLFITHDLGVVREIADRIIVMYAGHIVEEGPTAQILSNPNHPYTKGLIACVPRVEQNWDDRQELRPIPGVVADPGNPPSGCAFHPRCQYRASGLCDTHLPALEPVDSHSNVRCARWQDLAAGTP